MTETWTKLHITLPHDLSLYREEAEARADFARILDERMTTKKITNDKLAERYSKLTKRPLSKYSVRRYRTGEEMPFYQFVEAILNHHLLDTNIDADMSGQSIVSSKEKFDRVTLFQAAGLIEITPESIDAWNRSVIDSVGNQSGSFPAQWSTIMRKLIDFHTQGNRISLKEISQEVSLLTGITDDSSVKRHQNMFSETRSATTPSLIERSAFYCFTKLKDNQINFLEAQIDAGNLSLGVPPTRTAFTDRLNSLLLKLNYSGIGSSDLMTSSVGSIDRPTLSLWRSGKRPPSLLSLRELVKVIERFSEKAKISRDEINLLIHSAGYCPSELTDTTHDVIGRINDESRIKPLLHAIRSATDLAIPAATVAGERSNSDPLPGAVEILDWGREGGRYPRPDQVNELLCRYNLHLRDSGGNELTEDEIRKVVEIAEKDLERWRKLSRVEKILETKNSSSRTDRE